MHRLFTGADDGVLAAELALAAVPPMAPELMTTEQLEQFAGLAFTC
jgi:hypothetical protein